MAYESHEGEHGFWRFDVYDENTTNGLWRCSKCNRTAYDINMYRNMWGLQYKYCPNCGAKMDLEVNKSEIL